MADLVPRRQGRGALSAMTRDPFHRLQDVFDNFFSPLMRQWSGPTMPELAGMRFWDFDMERTENEVTVRAEMPGFEPDDIELSVEENTLTIRAEHRKETGEERDFRSFIRSVTLPTGTDPDQVKATYRNGVLEVHLPIREEAKPRRIRVQGDGAGEGRQIEPGAKKQPQEAEAKKPEEAEAKKPGSKA